MRKRSVILAGCAAVLATMPAAADECARTSRPGQGTVRPDCRPARLEPYDPDRARAGRDPGFVDLGNGTEIRIGGRARLDTDVRR